MRRPADNPFRSTCIDRLPYIAQEQSVEAIYQRFHHMQRRAALSGPHGSGKTCLLDALVERLHNDAYQTLRIQLHANERAPRLSTLIQRIRSHPDHLVIIDGADCVHRLYWNILKYCCRKYPGLLITTHEQKLLPVLHQQESNPAMLKQLIERLNKSGSYAINYSALWELHAGNLRDCLRHCYLEWQAQRL